MIRHPLRRPAPPSPEMTLPAINMLEELAVAQTMEPTSKIVMHHAKTHCISCQFHASCRGVGLFKGHSKVTLLRKRK